MRREFITFIGGAVGWPLTAFAEQPAIPVIGFLNGASPDGYAPMVSAFLQGLKDVGYIEGQNVAIEYRWAHGQYDRLRELADELVHDQVTVIAATSTPTNLIAKTATSTIPVVFTSGFDPVQLGLVASLNRPGGNVTGVTQLTGQTAPKRLELAHQLVPAASTIGLLLNPGNPNSEQMAKDMQAAATTLGLELSVFHASTEAELDEVFAASHQKGAGALVVGADAFFNSHLELLGALTVRHLVPTVYEFRQFMAAGGLASYGGSITDSYRLAGVYAGRILKGEKPADLPVQQSTKVELFINLKSAKTLGLTIPLSLLGRVR